MDDDEVGQVNFFVYLSSRFNEGAGCTDDVQTMGTVGTMATALMATADEDMENQIDQYCDLATPDNSSPMAFWSCDAWTLQTEEERRIQAF